MTRSIFALLALTVAACDADPNALPVDEAPPALGFDAFIAGDMVGGSPASVTWEDPNLVPGTTARLLLSPNGAGAGPCPPVLQGQCAGILSPVRRIATATVQPATTVTGALSGNTYTSDPWVKFELTVPAGLAFGTTFGLQAQAFDASGGVVLSDAIVHDIGFTPCSFIFSPTCGVDGLSYDNECVAEANGAVVLVPGPDGC